MLGRVQTGVDDLYSMYGRGDLDVLAGPDPGGKPQGPGVVKESIRLARRPWLTEFAASL